MRDLPANPLRLPGTVWPMLFLALPVLGEQTLTLLVGYTDWWLTGRFLEEVEYKAAMGLMSYITWLLPALFAAVAIGATALVARSVGAGDMRTARRAANQALLLGVLLAAAATLIAALLSPALISFMMLKEAAAGHAQLYIWILVPAIPLVMVQEVAAACFRGAGDTVSGMAAKTMVNIVNATISTLLVTGWLGAPKLGWMGLAIGTAAGHIVGGLILLALLWRGRAGIRLRAKWLRPDRPLAWRLLKIGLPGGVDIAAILFCQFLFVRIIFRLGDVAAAAHGLGVQIEALAYLPGSAFQTAAATMAGQYLGARDPARAVRGVLAALAAGGTLMTAAGVMFFFGGGALTWMFTGDLAEPSAAKTVMLLRIVAVSMPALASLMILNGALRGSGDTRWPLGVTLVGFLSVRIPLAYLFASDRIDWPWGGGIGGLDWGVAGAWYAMVLDLYVRSLLVAFRFWQGGWKKTRV